MKQKNPLFCYFLFAIYSLKTDDDLVNKNVFRSKTDLSLADRKSNTVLSENDLELP